MSCVGVLANFEFKAGYEAAAEEFFRAGREIVEGQPVSTRWYSFRSSPTTYGAFAVFASIEDRDALLAAGGPRSSAASAEVFETAPTFELVDIVAFRAPA